MAGGYGRGVHGRGHVWHGSMHGRGCVAGEHVWWGACVAGETATAVDGTHTTGMHSCFLFIITFKSVIMSFITVNCDLLSFTMSFTTTKRLFRLHEQSWRISFAKNMPLAWMLKHLHKKDHILCKITFQT